MRPTRVGLWIIGIGLLLALLATTVGAGARPQLGRVEAAPGPPASSSNPLVDATLRFDQSQYSVYLNDTFTADLVIDNVSNLGGWEVKLGYDPARLQITQVTLGGFLTSTGRTQQGLQMAISSSQLAIGAYSYGSQAAPSGSGVLAHLTLRALATGDTTLTLQDAILAGVTGPGAVQSLPVTPGDATVHIAPPLAVNLAQFEATSQPDGIRLTWETVSEIDNQGFNILRSQSPDELGALVAFVPSQSPGSGQGHAYEWLDGDVTAGETYNYWLEDVDAGGATTLHGPVSATFQAPTAVTVAGMQATARSRIAAVWWVFAAGLALLTGAGLVVKRK